MRLVCRAVRDCRAAPMTPPPESAATNPHPVHDQANLTSSRNDLREQFTAAIAEVETERLRLRGVLSVRSRELLQTRAELRALTEAFPDLLIRLDPDGTILECRAGEATGPYRLMESAVGQRLHDLPER